MDNNCRQVVLECPECKHHGPSYHNHLLQPIRRSKPFALICGDYLSLPKGFGGYSEVRLYIDVYSGFIWGTKLKSKGMAKSTINSLEHIFYRYSIPSAFMADGGSHFKNGEVENFCALNNVKHITTATNAPWCNGLVEGTNRLLLNRLHHLCSPNMDELVDSDTTINPESIPYAWPKHFDEAIRQLNDRIRPSILRTPRELMFGLAITPEHTPPDSLNETSIDMVDTNLSLVDMLHMQAHLLQLENAAKQKSTWDDRTSATEYNIRVIVQWHNGKLDNSYKTENKLVPYIISGKSLNSYSLSTLHGTEIPGSFHSRRLR